MSRRGASKSLDGLKLSVAHARQPNSTEIFRSLDRQERCDEQTLVCISVSVPVISIFVFGFLCPAIVTPTKEPSWDGERGQSRGW
jgi:hypothetical protein